MAPLEKNDPAPKAYIVSFLSVSSFILPDELIAFYLETNGAQINTNNTYTLIWPIHELISLNEAYAVEEFAPEFFLIGSDGGDTAFAVEKDTGHIVELPFIGMSKEEAVVIASSFKDFIRQRSIC